MTSRLTKQLDLYVPKAVLCPQCQGDAVHYNDGPLFVCMNDACRLPFCQLCGKMAHSPFTCQDWSKYVGQATVVEGVDARDMTKCPFCEYVQERIKGTCNKIVCGQNTHATYAVSRQGCRKAYCFVCRRPWADHPDYYRCTMPPKEDDDSQWLDQFKDMAAIERSNEQLAVFETAVATA